MKKSTRFLGMILCVISFLIGYGGVLSALAAPDDDCITSNLGDEFCESQLVPLTQGEFQAPEFLYVKPGLEGGPPILDFEATYGAPNASERSSYANAIVQMNYNSLALGACPSDITHRDGSEVLLSENQKIAVQSRYVNYLEAVSFTDQVLSARFQDNQEFVEVIDAIIAAAMEATQKKFISLCKSSVRDTQPRDDAPPTSLSDESPLDDLLADFYQAIQGIGADLTDTLLLSLKTNALGANIKDGLPEQPPLPEGIDATHVRGDLGGDFSNCEQYGYGGWTPQNSQQAINAVALGGGLNAALDASGRGVGLTSKPPYEWPAMLDGAGWTKLNGCTAKNALPGTVVTYPPAVTSGCGKNGGTGIGFDCGHVELVTARPDGSPCYTYAGTSGCSAGYGGSGTADMANAVCWVPNTNPSANWQPDLHVDCNIRFAN